MVFRLPKRPPVWPCTRHAIWINGRITRQANTHSQHSPPTVKPLLTEYIYGRTRIYTSLPSMAKGKPATSGKTRIGSPITSSRLQWKWLAPSTSADTHKQQQQQPYRTTHHFGVLGSIKQNLREMFLPVGYPESVHECYKRFHLWLALETFAGSAVGVLCSQAMLSSLGLGAAEATGGAVAIQWVLKDGIGEFGKLFFIKKFASSFDSHPKTWKMICEGFSAVGCFLQLCTAIASPKLFLPLAAVGNMFNLVHESIWVASHMTFTKHFAVTGNIGDLVAKDDAQMSTAHLAGMLSGVGLISISHDPTFLFGMFALLTPLNLWATVKMLNAAEFEILNQAKITLLSRTFIDTGKAVGYDALRDREIGFGEWIKPGSGGISLRIKLGASAEKAFASVSQVQDTVRIMMDENYLLNYHKDTMWVLLHEDAGPNDVIRSILHSLRFHDAICKAGLEKDKDRSAYDAALADSLAWSKENFPRFMGELEMKGWQSNAVYWNDGGIRVQWDGHREESSP